MRAFIAAVVVAVVLAGAAALVLGLAQRPAYQAYSTSGARVGDPGENLVGRNWNGLNAGQNAASHSSPQRS